MRVLFTKTRFPSTGVVGIIRGCPCISLDIHGCLQPSMDCKTYVRKEIQRYPWIYMYLITHKCTWTSRELYRCPQPSMDFHTYIRMDIHGFKYIQGPRRFNSCKMPRDIANVQVSLIAKIKVSFLTGQIWAPPSLLLGAHLTLATRHKNGTKRCAKEGARSAGGPLYDRMLAQNSIKHCTRETSH